MRKLSKPKLKMVEDVDVEDETKDLIKGFINLEPKRGYLKGNDLETLTKS